MQKKETKKLFYDEYLYKLVVRNNLGHIFRDKNFKYARDELDALQLMYEKGESLTRGSFRTRTYDVATFKEAKTLFSIFTKRNDYKLRIEQSYIQIYCNDKEFLLYVANKVQYPKEIWEPKHYLEKNIIILDKPSDYKYKVTLGDSVSPGLAPWIDKNSTLAKAGPVCLEEIKNNGYTKGFYIYVRDDKVLNLVKLMLGNIGRVDKIIYKQDLDK